MHHFNTILKYLLPSVNHVYIIVATTAVFEWNSW